MPKLLKLLFVLFLAGGALVACGGDDDDSNASSNVDVEADVDGDPDLDDVVDDLAAFGSEECLKASAAYIGALGGLGGLFSGGANDLGESVEELERFAADAPVEIKADLEIVAGDLAVVAEALAESGFDPSSGEQPNEEQMAAFEEASKTIEGSDFEAASERIGDWFKENCGTGG